MFHQGRKIFLSPIFQNDCLMIGSCFQFFCLFAYMFVLCWDDWTTKKSTTTKVFEILIVYTLGLHSCKMMVWIQLHPRPTKSKTRRWTKLARFKTISIEHCVTSGCQTPFGLPDSSFPWNWKCIFAPLIVVRPCSGPRSTRVTSRRTLCTGLLSSKQ